MSATATIGTTTATAILPPPFKPLLPGEPVETSPAVGDVVAEELLEECWVFVGWFEVSVLVTVCVDPGAPETKLTEVDETTEAEVVGDVVVLVDEGVDDVVDDVVVGVGEGVEDVVVDVVVVVVGGAEGVVVVGDGVLDVVVCPVLGAEEVVGLVLVVEELSTELEVDELEEAGDEPADVVVEPAALVELELSLLDMVNRRRTGLREVLKSISQQRKEPSARRFSSTRSVDS